MKSEYPGEDKINQVIDGPAQRRLQHKAPFLLKNYSSGTLNGIN